jgi:spermidine/putrescine transport system substrate-binding protein
MRLRFFLFVVTLMLAGCSKPKAQLNVFIWSEYLDPAVVADFERQFDCKVTLDYYEDPEGMMAKLSAGGDSLYDIVVPGNTTLPALIKRGLVAPLRAQNVPNLVYIDPQFTNTMFDPGNRFGAPYQWGTTGLYLRQGPGQRIKETWGLVFDPAQTIGRFLLIDDPRSCIGVALKYQGKSLNTADANDLAAVRRMLIEAKSRALGFEAAVAGRNRVLSKDAAVAIVYSGDAVRGMDEDSATRYFIPREGGELWLDCLSIPARAPNRDLAERFINYLLEPSIAARTARFNRVATPNQAAKQFVDPKDLQNPAIYPPPDVMSRLEFANDLGEANRLYAELWTEIKAR